MGKILKKSFFKRDTVLIANELLGAFLVRKIRNKFIRAQITEVEVYDGFFDKASHASRGKTSRNTPMFGAPGHWYIYFTYGMHWMLNIVTREEGYPAAILIRGVSGINGPAKLTKALGITGSLNGKPANKKSGLWISPVRDREGSQRASISNGIEKKPKIHASARIGVHYAGPYWAKRKLRFSRAPTSSLLRKK